MTTPLPTDWFALACDILVDAAKPSVPDCERCHQAPGTAYSDGDIWACEECRYMLDREEEEW